MCGSLKFENQQNRLFVRGQSIPNNNLDIPKEAQRPGGYIWDGHARSDGSVYNGRTMQQQWLVRGFEPATIKGVEMFTERKKLNNGQMQTTEISLNDRAQLGALINRKTGILVILTRPAKTKNEKQTHHRFPVYVQNRKHLVDAINKKFGKDTI